MTVPLAWTQAGYERPNRGAVPPQVGGTAAAFGKQQVEVVAQGTAQQQTIAPDVQLAQLQPVVQQVRVREMPSEKLRKNMQCMNWQELCRACPLQMP